MTEELKSILIYASGAATVFIFQWIMRGRILKAKVKAINFGIMNALPEAMKEKYIKYRNESYEDFVEEQTLLKK